MAKLGPLSEALAQINAPKVTTPTGPSEIELNRAELTLIAQSIGVLAERLADIKPSITIDTSTEQQVVEVQAGIDALLKGLESSLTSNNEQAGKVITESITAAVAAVKEAVMGVEHTVVLEQPEHIDIECDIIRDNAGDMAKLIFKKYVPSDPVDVDTVEYV